eukprot:3371875-Alexandrium_andersonii.AAC.1
MASQSSSRSTQPLASMVRPQGSAGRESNGSSDALPRPRPRLPRPPLPRPLGTGSGTGSAEPSWP